MWLRANDYVKKQIENHSGEWIEGDYQSIELGRFAESTIRKAINFCGFSAIIDNCGNVFAKCRAI